jgi:hypothetical protein
MQENSFIKKKIEKNMGIKKLSLKLNELVFPMVCFSKNSIGYKKLLFHHKQREIVSKELDILNIIPKLYSVDKLSYLLAGKEYMWAISIISNPFLYPEDKFLEKTEFSELRDLILNLNFKSSS